MTRNVRLLNGRYEVGELLGYGGMAEVHRGRDIRLGRSVAIKRLRSDLAGDAMFLDRFRLEAQNSATLNHPAIVAVYDTGEESRPTGEQVPFIVMELVDGRTLRDVLAAERRIRPRRALEMIADVCAALEFSHRHGIVHRDVKPGNVMITQDGRVKVMDFGIAHNLAGRDTANTDSHAVIGTAAYLAPEQARGEPVDGRSDVYAAGCVLFELIVGQPPFVGGSPVSIAYRHVREDPRPPSDFNREVPRDVDAIVLKALAKRPGDRFRSAARMREASLQAIGGRPAPTTRPQPPRTGPTVYAPRGPAVYASHPVANRSVPDVTPVLPIITYGPEAPRMEFAGLTAEELDARRQEFKRQGDVAIKRRDWARLTSLRQQESAVTLELLRRFRSPPPPDRRAAAPHQDGRLPDRSRSRAIIIGTSRYADPDLPDIPAVSHNLRDLRSLLTHQGNGGFDSARVHVSENPGREVGEWVAELAENTEDTLFVYFAGHGMTGSDGELYLGLPGTKSKRPVFSALPYQELRRAISDSPARNKVVTLDCCYAGHAIGLMSGDDVHGGAIDVQGTYVITSTSAVQRAHAPQGARHSAFTGELIDLLANGTTDSGNLIRLGDIYAHLRRRLIGRGLPKPQQRGVDTVTGLALTRNPAWSGPA